MNLRISILQMSKRISFILILTMVSTTCLILPKPKQVVSTRKMRAIVDTLDQVCLYSQHPVLVYDCEHVVPRSFIRDSNTERDLHLIFKCTPSLNRSRQNKKFIDVLPPPLPQSPSIFVNPTGIYLFSNKARALVSCTCLYYLYTHMDYFTRDSFYNSVISKNVLEEWYDVYGKTLITEQDKERNQNIYKIQGNKNYFL